MRLAFDSTFTFQHNFHQERKTLTAAGTVTIAYEAQAWFFLSKTKKKLNLKRHDTGDASALSLTLRIMYVVKFGGGPVIRQLG